MSREVANFRTFWKATTFSSVLEPVIYLRRLRARPRRDDRRPVDGLEYVEFVGTGMVATAVIFSSALPGDVRHLRQGALPAHLRRDPRRARRRRGARDRRDALDRAARGVYGCFPLIVSMLFGLDPAPGMLLVPFFCFITALGFAAFGIAVAGSVSKIDQFNYVTTLVITPLFLVAGTFFPIDQLPQGFQVAAQVNPLHHLVELVRGASFGFEWTDLIRVAVLVGFVGRALAARGPPHDGAPDRLTPLDSASRPDFLHTSNGSSDGVRHPSGRMLLPTDTGARARGDLLLTGSTGFLGMELLARLLEDTDRRVWAPVRAEDGRGRRGSAAGHAVDAWSTDPDAYADRVVALGGRPRPSPGLGLTAPAAVPRSPRQVDEIIHCAASVSFSLPLDEARSINVEGTRARAGAGLGLPGTGWPAAVRSRLDRVCGRRLTAAFSPSPTTISARASTTPTSSPSGRRESLLRRARRADSGPDLPAQHRRRPRPQRLDRLLQRHLHPAAGVCPAARCRAIPARRSAPVDVVPVSYVAGSILRARRRGCRPHLQPRRRARRAHVAELIDLTVSHSRRPADPRDRLAGRSTAALIQPLLMQRATLGAAARARARRRSSFRTSRARRALQDDCHPGGARAATACARPALERLLRAADRLRRRLPLGRAARSGARRRARRPRCSLPRLAGLGRRRRFESVAEVAGGGQTESSCRAASSRLRTSRTATGSVVRSNMRPARMSASVCR